LEKLKFEPLLNEATLVARLSESSSQVGALTLAAIDLQALEDRRREQQNADGRAAGCARLRGDADRRGPAACEAAEELDEGVGRLAIQVAAGVEGEGRRGAGVEVRRVGGEHLLRDRYGGRLGLGRGGGGARQHGGVEGGLELRPGARRHAVVDADADGDRHRHGQKAEQQADIAAPVAAEQLQHSGDCDCEHRHVPTPNSEA
jgi:hypothetical protein